ncbi:guanylate kinase [Gottschalkia purinilytica]|uniref:Guanylate kinase n=1 Tax=Gottschalkia purinilytica TaxID=1503 RepID=A0A0L0W634_GOTPU|nr:AAA family ATPase [Gottschalkia purinilytica]KNF06952.1 guanylate kinase [Gottschalkia purinilytica]
MDKIICLVGPSGSGKTTIAKELETLGYNIIHSYTTREPREENEWGHIFMSDDSWFCRDKENSIAEKELYDHAYWATKEQYKNKGTSIYVVCPDGAKQVRKNVKDAEIVTIFLHCDMNKRVTRLIERAGGNIFNHFDEVEALERINKDKEVFKLVKTDYVIDGNREVEEVLEDVVSVIKN